LAADFSFCSYICLQNLQREKTETDENENAKGTENNPFCWRKYGKDSKCGVRRKQL